MGRKVDPIGEVGARESAHRATDCRMPNPTAFLSGLKRTPAETLPRDLKQSKTVSAPERDFQCRLDVEHHALLRISHV